MSQTVHLFLKANGSDIKGESTQKSLNRDGSIEAVWYEQVAKTAREAGTGLSTGRRHYDPIVIRKRIDKSSPLLWKALVENQVIEGTFKFYRPSPKGDGTTEQFYTVKIGKGRIASVKQWNPDTLESAVTQHWPPLEEVAFVFHDISWTFEDGGVTHADTWDQAR